MAENLGSVADIRKNVIGNSAAIGDRYHERTLMNVTTENKSFIIVRIIMVSLCLIATVVSVFVVWEFQTRRSAALFATFAQESLEELETRFHRIESVLDGGGRTYPCIADRFCTRMVRLCCHDPG